MTKRDWLQPGYIAYLQAYERIFVAYSGGLDSTVLLQFLAKNPTIRHKLIAVHINHGLSPNAKNWELHCQAFAKKQSVPFVTRQLQLNAAVNIEEIAREARYKALALLLDNQDCLVLGHHQDDQAETLLLQIMRGSGVDGLAAMQSQKKFAKGMMFRPLLDVSRQELEEYAKEWRLSWIEDESNENRDFSRNFLRKEIFPLLQQKWPAASENISRAAKHCQLAQANLEELAKLDAAPLNLAEPILVFSKLLHLDEARLANLLRVWLKSNQIKPPSSRCFQRIIDELIHARPDAEPLVSWGDISLRRYQDRIHILRQGPSEYRLEAIWNNFPKDFRICDNEYLQALPATSGFLIPKGAILEVRYRQGGEVFRWHGQNKQLKKCLQDWSVPIWLRDKLPLIYLNNCLAVIPGFAISDDFFGHEQAFEIIWQHP